jgi:hypothetical protein
MRAELWEHLAAQMEQTQATTPEREGFGIQ